jgi:Trk K+ transport system NAD-binding subunit
VRKPSSSPTSSPVDTPNSIRANSTPPADRDPKIYKVAPDSKAAGKTAQAIDQELSDASVEAIYREGKTFDLTDETLIQTGDRIAITGMISILEERCCRRRFGRR